MTIKLHLEEFADLPPSGSSNPDPITGAPGCHPLEAAVGAAVGGAMAGVAVGSVAGPVGTAIGAAAGAVAGGLAGKGIGELIDPTIEDGWLRENFQARPYAKEGDDFEEFFPAFHYGALAESRIGDAGIDLADEQLQSDWEASKECNMPWTKAKEAVKDAYDRAVRLRQERNHSGDQAAPAPEA